MLIVLCVFATLTAFISAYHQEQSCGGAARRPHSQYRGPCIARPTKCTAEMADILRGNGGRERYPQREWGEGELPSEGMGGWRGGNCTQVFSSLGPELRQYTGQAWWAGGLLGAGEEHPQKVH